MFGTIECVGASKDYSSRERRVVALLSQKSPQNLNGILIILLGVAVPNIQAGSWIEGIV